MQSDTLVSNFLHGFSEMGTLNHIKDMTTVSQTARDVPSSPGRHNKSSSPLAFPQVASVYHLDSYLCKDEIISMPFDHVI